MTSPTHPLGVTFSPTFQRFPGENVTLSEGRGH